MARGSMTLADFEAQLPKLGRLTLNSVNIARAVLVDGVYPAEAGHQHGMTRQRVNGILKRFDAATKEVPHDWRRVEVWLPPELAAQVEALAQKARDDYAGTESGSSGSPA